MGSLTARLGGLRKWLPETLLFVVLIGGIHIYHTRDMLNASEEPAPPLALVGLDGAAGGLQAGDDRVTLVYFFAPWCHVCAASAHNIRNLQKIRGDEDLAVMMVALDWQDADEVRAYVERHELDVQVLLGNRGTAKDWGVSVFPTYYILDGNQRVVHRDFGYSTLAGLWLRTLLAG